MTPLRLFFWAHWFGIMMVVVGIVPGLNRLYSGHGGLAWFALPLSFPLAVCIYFSTYRSSASAERPVLWNAMKRSLLAYAMFTPSGSFVASLSIETAYGLQLPPLQLWGMFFFPINLVLDPSVFG
jgi:hypothetical protein